MTDTKHIAGGVALKAALAILKETVTPLQHRQGGGHVTGGHLAGIIARETKMAVLIAAIEEAMAEIEYCHADMLTEHRHQPRCRGWGRVYDKLAASRDLLKGSAA
jgi:hypothetical protein